MGKPKLQKSMIPASDELSGHGQIRIIIFGHIIFRPILMLAFLKNTAFVCLLFTGMIACQPGQKSAGGSESAALPYDLTKPADRFEMPKVLTEISGLTYYKPGKLACVQDELGSVFFYDLKKRGLSTEQVFMPGGDYEGIEFANGRMYVLRSDGELYWVEPDESSIKSLGGGPVTHHIQIGLPGKIEVEGLGYDPKLNALLLAVKESDRAGTDKPMYYYGLKADVLYAGPRLKQADILAIDDSGEKEIKPSGVAVHPTTRDYYWLASVGHRLIVTSPGGKIKSVTKLDKTLFRQPEGICFAPDGTLFIASEGDGGKGYILQFAAKTAN